MRIFFAIWSTALLLFFSVNANAVNLFNLDSQPLPQAQAYQFAATRAANTINAHWTMAKGYYLYADRFCFIVNGKMLAGVKLPPAEWHHDELLGAFKAYANDLNVTISLPAQYANQSVQLQVCYQGCSSGHFCYPPTTAHVTLPTQASDVKAAQIDTKIPALLVAKNSRANNIPEQDRLASSLAKRNVWLNLLSFFSIGFLLAFTPCVLPMLPILSSLILGHEGMTSARAAGISLVYVLSMALTYAVIGLIAGFAGANLQVWFQAPLAIGFMSLLFVLLALSLFGFYEIRLPARLQMKLTTLSNHQKSGSIIGAALMGCLATLIVSPCVSPALIAAVTYIAQTGNGWMGGVALFVMAIGMGTPLFLVGTFGGRILPRAGRWMITVKQVLGVLMLMMAILLLSRIIPIRMAIGLWAALLIISSVYLGLLQPALTGWAKFWKGLGLLFAISGTLLLVDAVQGNTGVFQLFTPWTNAQAKSSVSEFTVVNTQADLKNLLTQAKKENKITVLDFYADWCLACKEMDIRTLSNSEVKQALQPMQRVRIDITTESQDIKMLKKQYNVIAPPTIIFLDQKGNEIPHTRLVGDVGTKALLEEVKQIE